MKKGLLSLFIIICSFCLSAQETQKLTAAKHNEYGLIYSLPVTHLKITVEVEKTIKKAGPFYKYAKRYLGTDNAIENDAESWTLKSISVTPYGVPDKENQYLMQFKNGSTPFLMINNQGLPMSINVEVPAETPTEAPQSTNKIENGNNNLLNTNLMSGEMLTSQSTAKKAELAANQIYRIRESRTNFITGDADQMPPDGNALKLLMSELDSQEKGLTELFVGAERKSTVIKEFDYVPSEEVSNDVIFRLSNFAGVVDNNNLSGEPIYLTLKVKEEGFLPINEKGEEKRIPKGAVMYKIPGKAQITLTYKGKTIYDETLQVSQYGVDFGLNPAMFTDKKQPAYLIFDTETGGIKELGTVKTESDK